LDTERNKFMKVEKEKLLKILSDCALGLSDKGLVEGSNLFTFSGTHVITYNDQIAVFSPFETDFQCSVPAKELLNVVSNIDDKEFDLVFSKDKLKVRTDKTRASLATFNTESILESVSCLFINESPSFQMEKIKWDSLPKNFDEAIDLCSFSISPHALHGWMSCVLCDGNFVSGTDNFRISRYQVEKKFSESFLIPGRFIPGILKFGFTDYCLDKSWIYFKKDKLVFCCRRSLDEFSDVSKFMEVEGRKLRLPKELKKAVEDVSFFTEGDFESDQFIKVLISSEGIKCKGKKETGWIEKKIDFKYKGESFFFNINPKFFSQILNHSTIMICGEGRGLFVSDNFQHVLLFFNKEVDEDK